MDRVQLMSGKAYSGLKHRAFTKYGETKEYVLQTLGDLQTAMLLVRPNVSLFFFLLCLSNYFLDGIRKKYVCLGESNDNDHVDQCSRTS
jgi:hypothetical protein